MDSFDTVYTGNIYELYRGYVDWSTGFPKDRGGFGILRRLITGNSEYNRQKEHEIFSRQLKGAVEEYGEALRDGLGREELLPLMEYALIGCHEGVDEGTDWMLLAAERLFMPFLELLSGEEAASLYEPYRRLRRKNIGLPPQSEILKTLKKMRK